MTNSARIERRILAFAIGCAASLFPGLSRSDERPRPPPSPVSVDECENFKKQHLTFANSLTRKSVQCERGYLLQVKNDDYIHFSSSCGKGEVTAVRQCSEEFDGAFCAWATFRREYNDCVHQAYQNEAEDHPKMRKVEQAINLHTIALFSGVLTGVLRVNSALTSSGSIHHHHRKYKVRYARW
jgi:hypothetical protein